MVIAKRIEQFWDAVMKKDMSGIEAAYVPVEETYVILEGPRYSTLGFPKIIKGWGDFTNSPITLLSIVWVEGPFEEIEHEMAWVAGITDITISVNGKEFTTRFRCSFVMKLVDDDWKIKHEHVSAPLEDPYGIGDWLKPAASA